jgi:hypothetical protein
MKHPWEWNEADAQSLIDDQVQENSELEYKACAALDRRDEKKKDEVSKDVSAFANAGGGVIIYGVHESNHVPTAIDVGYDQNQISKEWLEQIINSRIQRRIDDIRINPVALKNSPGRVIFVVDIPQSSRAPHMAADKRYYKRFNFQSVAMEEYEVRDVARRSEAPDLRVDFEVLPGTRPPGIPVFRLRAMISNDSPEPVFYGVINIFIDSAVTVLDMQELTSAHEIHEETLFGQVVRFKILQRIWSGQSGLPIWLGQPLPVSFNGILLGAPRLDACNIIGWQVTSPKMPLKKGFYRLDSSGLAPLV